MKLVLVIFGSLRADHVSLYGNRWLATERFTSLGQRARVFTGARCRRPDPCAVRAELFTGLSGNRFREPQDILGQYQSEFTLPGRLKAAGYQTALFTDNFPFRSLYEPLTAFDTVCYIPGQGYDRHVPESGLGPAESAHQPLPAVIHGGGTGPDSENVRRYVRNRISYARQGHPSVRLFQAAAEYLKSNREGKTFTLIDSYGLAPPWDAPQEFARHRRPEDLSALAWPTEGRIDAEGAGAQADLNFLRRAYADGCLFIDHVVGMIPQDKDQTLLVMSDHGVLVGDEGYVLVPPNGQFPALVDQVLITRSPRIQAPDRRDMRVHSADIFATLLATAGPEHLPPSDGRVIEDLLT